MLQKGCDILIIKLNGIIIIILIVCMFQVEDVRLLDRHNKQNTPKGTLYLTATHLIFVGTDKKETWVSEYMQCSFLDDFLSLSIPLY